MRQRLHIRVARPNQGEDSLSKILDFPLVLFVVSLLTLGLFVRLGFFLTIKRPVTEDERDDLNLVISASVTLLALIIGFSFSMAVSRYDQRKNYEEEEANAIGTEYLRADLLPAADAASVRHLMRQYLQQRLQFYTVRDPRLLTSVDTETTRLQTEMWSTVQNAAKAQPTAAVALVVAGMNDVLNREGYTQAAWWNRIPFGAWSLMITLAICCSLLLGYGTTHERWFLLSMVLPFLVSIAFFLIADIDSPRRGVIRVAPQNLISLSRSLQPAK
jgi:hypothetical protein